MKEEYIAEINKLLNLADIETLDFVFQFLQQCVKEPLTPSKEHPQIA